jgi:hypothetical protein
VPATKALACANTNINLGFRVSLGRKVVVICRGNVAFDDGVGFVNHNVPYNSLNAGDSTQYDSRGVKSVVGEPTMFKLLIGRSFAIHSQPATGPKHQCGDRA